MALRVISISYLSAAQGFSIIGDPADGAGFSVSDAGDVNGDGIDDVIVGAPYDDDGGSVAGAAYVIYGRTGPRGPLDLSALAAADGFAIVGDVAGDRAGIAVSGAGDVNGDGIDDLIVGAPEGGNGSSGGEAYVIYGRTGARGPLDLTGFAAADGFAIIGDAAVDLAGRSVSDAGDVNGDGIADLIVGAPFGNDGGNNAGEAYVIYGRTGARGPLDLTGLAAADGFAIIGDAAYDYLGLSVSDAGDVNGDGIADLIVGAPLGDDGGTNAGEAYVIYGRTGPRGPLDLSNLATSDGFIIIGDAAGDRTGNSVSGAGDVNGDGIADLIVGAYRGDDGGTDAGEAYVIYGRTGPRGPLDLSTLAAADGFVLIGDALGDRTGGSVSGAGDVDGDGIADLIVGSRFNDLGSPNAGASYLIYGSIDPREPLDLSTLAAADGFVIIGFLNSGSGISVSDAGDVNGDGLTDLIVGARSDVIYGFRTAPVNAAPVIVSDGGEAAAAINALENSTALTNVIANDPDAGDTVTYTITGGADADRFAIDAATGALVFLAAPDFEAHTDADGNNIYEVIVRATDSGGLFDEQTLTIAVNDVEEGNPGVTITGTQDKDVINTRKGPAGQPLATDRDDTIFGLGGNDSIDGGAGNDRMVGGTGNDSYTIDSVGDVVVELAEEGRDTMKSGVVDLILADNVESGTLLNVKGVGADLNITGNALDNSLNGNLGANTLSGGEGFDKLNGKGGADTLFGGAGADQFTFDKFALDGSVDTIDFSIIDGDEISLAGIDADGDTANGNSKFAFLGTAAFTGAGGEVRYEAAGGDTLVLADIDGNAVADLTIRVTGNIGILADYFIL